MALRNLRKNRLELLSGQTYGSCDQMLGPVFTVSGSNLFYLAGGSVQVVLFSSVQCIAVAVKLVQT